MIEAVEHRQVDRTRLPLHANVARKIAVGAGFDSTILYKQNAPDLLRATFEKPSWRGELILFGALADCYQPSETKLHLTRACLQVCLAYKNPVAIVTKGVIIERDLALLVRLHEVTAVHVSVNIPVWRKEHARLIEPGVPSPQRRMGMVARLKRAGLSVGVNLAPFVPTMSDIDAPGIVGAAADIGVDAVGLQLSGMMRENFLERLHANPEKRDAVLAALERPAELRAKIDNARQLAHAFGLRTAPHDRTTAEDFASASHRNTFTRPSRQLHLF